MNMSVLHHVFIGSFTKRIIIIANRSKKSLDQCCPTLFSLLFFVIDACTIIKTGTKHYTQKSRYLSWELKARQNSIELIRYMKESQIKENHQDM